VVEFLAAGVIAVAHDTAGPKVTAALQPLLVPGLSALPTFLV
jgi:hypothetical protein